MLAEDTLKFSNALSLVMTTISMVDGRYAIVYAESKNSNTTLQNPFLSQGGIYAIFLEYGKVAERQPAVLHQTPISGLRFIGIVCSISYVGVGQTCIVTGNFTNLAATDIFYLKIDFLSSGTISKVEPLNVQSMNVQSTDKYDIFSLRYGGYLFFKQKVNDANELFMYGYITNGSETYTWDLPNPTKTNFDGVRTILNNNTFVLAPPEGTQNWSLITTDLFKFEEEQGKVTREKIKVKNLKKIFFKYYMNL